MNLITIRIHTWKRSRHNPPGQSWALDKWKKNVPVTQNEHFFRQAPHASLKKMSTQIIEVLGSWNLESIYRDRDNKPILACGARPTPCLLGLRTKVQKIQNHWSEKGSTSLVHKAETHAVLGPHSNASGAVMHWVQDMRRSCGTRTATVRSASQRHRADWQHHK